MLMDGDGRHQCRNQASGNTSRRPQSHSRCRCDLAVDFPLNPLFSYFNLKKSVLSYKTNFCWTQTFMFSRLSQVARHLSRRAITSFVAPSTSAPRRTSTGFFNSIMGSTVTADERNARTIHTAACLIIGDEVLGGKARPINTC